jgi:hypothetical protein
VSVHQDRIKQPEHFTRCSMAAACAKDVGIAVDKPLLLLS